MTVKKAAMGARKRTSSRTSWRRGSRSPSRRMRGHRGAVLLRDSVGSNLMILSGRLSAMANSDNMKPNGPRSSKTTVPKTTTWAPRPTVRQTPSTKSPAPDATTTTRMKRKLKRKSWKPNSNSNKSDWRSRSGPGINL